MKHKCWYLYCSFTPSDPSLVSFEAVDKPNYFLYASHEGNLRLTKWEESDAFWDGATFVLHRDTSVPGYDSMESFSKRVLLPPRHPPGGFNCSSTETGLPSAEVPCSNSQVKCIYCETGMDRKKNKHKKTLSAYGYLKPG